MKWEIEKKVAKGRENSEIVRVKGSYRKLSGEKEKMFWKEKEIVECHVSCRMKGKRC